MVETTNGTHNINTVASQSDKHFTSQQSSTSSERGNSAMSSSQRKEVEQRTPRVYNKHKVGQQVSAKVGPKRPLCSGRKYRDRERLYGVILESYKKNKVKVIFDNNTVKTLHNAVVRIESDPQINDSNDKEMQLKSGKDIHYAKVISKEEAVKNLNALIKAYIMMYPNELMSWTNFYSSPFESESQN